MIVLIVFTLLMILGSSILTVSVSDNKQAAYQLKKTQAYYTAYSGANCMASYIISNPDKLSNVIDKQGTSEIDGNKINVEVTKNGPTTDNLLITSTGTVSGASPVNVNLYLERIINPIFDYTVFGDTLVKIGNNTDIYGDVGTNASSIDNKGTFVNGHPFTNLGIKLLPTDSSKFTYNNGPYKLKDGDKLYYKTSKIDDDLIKKITWDSSHVTGGQAQIHLFAEDSLEINTIVPPSGITVFLYYNGNDSITTNNGNYSINNCVIYAPFAEFSKNGAGNGDYIGGIMILNKCILPNSHAKIEPDPSINKMDIVGAQTYIRKKWSE